MAISITTGFDVKSRSPIDVRLCLTKAQMLAQKDQLMPDKYFAICQDDGNLYLYDQSNTIDPVTGKFRILELNIEAGEDGQILVYNDGAAKWKPAPFVDGKTVINTLEGAQLKGFASVAQNNWIPYKDASGELGWKAPLDQSALDEAVLNANAAANRAGASATAAGSAQADAELAARQAQNLNQATVQYVNNKFWWGTETEFNALTSIDEGTFYFVQI